MIWKLLAYKAEYDVWSSLEFLDVYRFMKFWAIKLKLQNIQPVLHLIPAKRVFINLYIGIISMSVSAPEIKFWLSSNWFRSGVGS